ncbi:hypothetical protein CR513_10216, partial [Mucuna pruriens]
MVPADVDAIALNVKVKKFNQARVNGGSNYDSLKEAKYSHCPCLLSSETIAKGTGLAESVKLESRIVPVETETMSSRLSQLRPNASQPTEGILTS